MYPLMVLFIASLIACYLETHCYLLVLKCLALIKASNWYYLMEKCLVMYL